MADNEGTTPAGDWAADRARYGRLAWALQPSFWAVGTYRFGQWGKSVPRLLRTPIHAVYFAAYSAVRLATGIDLPRAAAIGPGLLIHHFGGIIVSPEAVIGTNFTMRQGVTIGSRVDAGPCPTIGNGVTVGAYAQILGNVRLGDGSTVGALTLVIEDVPADTTVVGIPSRILRH